MGVVLSEGQRRLAERPEGVVELGQMLGVDPRRVDDWKTGRTKPTSENALKLRDVLQIPMSAWSRLPGSPELDLPLPVTPVSASSKTPTALEEVDSMLAALRVEGDLTEKDRARRSTERYRLLSLKSKMEQQKALLEDAVVRVHPQWARIREALKVTLAKHPDALADVAAALRGLDAWDSAVAEVDADDGEDDE